MISTFAVVKNQEDADAIRQRDERITQRMWKALEKRCQRGTQNEAEELKARAEAGEIEAMTVLAAFYEQGIGVQQDTSRAAELYRKASQAIPNYRHNKAHDHSKRTWTNFSLVRPLMKKAAQLGDDFALGECYNIGGPLGFDQERSRMYYKRAADKGDPEAMFNLGQSYSYPFDDSAPQPDLAEKYLHQAAELGHLMALQNAVVLSKDDAERVKWLKLLAEKCDDQLYSSLVNELAVRYEQGDGVPRDERMAVKWHAKAAELGDIDSFLALARCCELGKGVAQDEDQAIELYLEAARRGSGKAMYELGLRCEAAGLKEDMAAWFCQGARHWYLPAKKRFAECLEYGIGMPRDITAAIEEYKNIANTEPYFWSQEDNTWLRAQAAYHVAMAYKAGQGVDTDIALSVKWLKKAAKLGSSEAMFTLGQHSERGEGMRKSPKIAVKWYEAAANLDHQPAAERLKELTENH